MAELAYHEEEALGRAYDARLMRRLLQYLRPYKWRVAAAVFFVLAGAGLQILGPYLIKVAIDGDIANGDAPGLARVAILFVCVLLLEFVVGYYQMSIMQAVGQRIMFDLRMQLFGKLQRSTTGTRSGA
jgi:ATP-binding cassette subfamily B multidrug efflux pump